MTGRFVCRGPGIVVEVVDRPGGQRGMAAIYERDLRLSESAVHDRLWDCFDEREQRFFLHIL